MITSFSKGLFHKHKKINKLTTKIHISIVFTLVDSHLRHALRAPKKKKERPYMVGCGSNLGKSLEKSWNNTPKPVTLTHKCLSIVEDV
jgi:hypothetical protein